MSGMGSASLRKHLDGKRLTPLQAIRAKCAECCGDYADGRLDCLVAGCPLYGFMPYRDREDPGTNDSGPASPTP